MSHLIPAVGSALALSAALIWSNLALPASAQPAGGRIVNCQVVSGGATVVSGKCLFKSAGGGSFTLENPDVRRSLTGPVLLVTVSVVSPGVAEVRGLTKDGINSRWGEARRSGQNRGCWVGSDFRVCAW